MEYKYIFDERRAIDLLYDINHFPIGGELHVSGNEPEKI
jgi:hypothetical protein